MSTRLYYESHVTIDPVVGERYAYCAAVGAFAGFRLAELFMLKDGTPHTEDTFMTCRTKDLEGIKSRTLSVVQELERNGFHVRRWKIEHVILDSKSGDDLEVLRPS